MLLYVILQKEKKIIKEQLAVVEMECTVISIPNGETTATTASSSSSSSPNYNSKQRINTYKEKGFSMNKCNRLLVMILPAADVNLIHSIKVGIALVLVSLLYLLDPLFKQVGENAMWAIMTVVVVFEFYAGATLSKGINRGIGTIIGGGLGCLAAILADEAGQIGNAIVLGTSVFIVGAAATYSRLIPKVKRRYDYGVMIFILTFNLVAVSGLRADTVMKLAKERLSTIGMGFIVCIFTSLLIFPMWASDELHCSTATKFEKLASSIEVCLEEYLMTQSIEEKPNVNSISQACNSVLHSKSKDETLANFAKWEPWHGKFGFSHPWEKYLEIGEVLRELAAIIISLQTCIQSPRQPAPTERRRIQEPCEMIGLSVTWILRELGESIMKMKKCESKVSIVPKHQSMKEQLRLLNSVMQTAQGMDPDEHFAAVGFGFLLTEISEKAQILVEKVEIFGQLASL